MRMDKEILHLAREARKISEKQAALEGFDKDLCGFCARGSAILFDLLQDKGYNPIIALSEFTPHVFIIIKNHIVDITATQYRDCKKEVFITEFPSPLKRYRVNKTFSSVEDLTTYQTNCDWVEDQIP